MSTYAEHLETLRDALGEGDLHEAERCLDKVKGLYVDGDAPYNGYEAILLWRLGESDQAFEAFRLAMEEAHNAEIAANYILFLLAHPEIREKSVHEMREMLEPYLESDSDMAIIHMAISELEGRLENYVTAAEYLKRGVRRNADYASEAFRLAQRWVQHLCDENRKDDGIALSRSLVDFFDGVSFLLLHARLCELMTVDREAVKYYKLSLPHLERGSKLRTEVLESIAKLAQ